MNDIDVTRLEDLEGEEWRNVNYLPPSIKVSSLGRVKRYYTGDQAELVHLTVVNGYYAFTCHYKTYAVHRVVADAFLSDPPKVKRPIVIHKNGDKKDSRVENLAWGNSELNFSKGTNQHVTTRRKVYCVETDQLFGSLTSACYILRLPQEVVAAKMKVGESCLGYTLKHVSAEDPELVNHKILYMSLEKIIELADQCSDSDELHALIVKEVGEGIPNIV